MSEWTCRGSQVTGFVARCRDVRPLFCSFQRLHTWEAPSTGAAISFSFLCLWCSQEALRYVCMCVHTHVCICTCRWMCVCMYMQVNARACICTYRWKCVCAYVHAGEFVCVRTCIHTYRWMCVCAYVHAGECMYVHMYMQVNVCVCAHTCICTCRWICCMMKVDLGYQSSRTCPLTFLDNLLLNLDLVDLVDYLTNRLHGSPCFCFYNAEIIDICHHIWLLGGYWGSEHRSLCLRGKDYTDFLYFHPPNISFK